MSEKVMELAASIRETMESAAQWEKKRTSVPGIFLVRLPGPQFKVMLEFNPPDEAGAPSKRKGLYFTDPAALKAARRAFADERMDDLVAAIHALQEKPAAREAPAERVFEV